MELYLVRHAESTNNRLIDDLRASNEIGLWPEKRVADPALTERGVQQAKALASVLRKQTQVAETRLFCSGMRRAAHTASILSEKLHVKPTLWVDVHEVGGIYHSNKKETSSESFHGMSLTQMKENFPNVILPNQNAVSDFAVDVAANQSQIDENGWWQKNRPRETYNEAVARAMRVVSTLQNTAKNAEEKGIKIRVWIVTHGDFLDILMRTLFSLLPARNFSFHHNNAGVTSLLLDGRAGHGKLKYLNRVVLPNDAHTWRDDDKYDVPVELDMDHWSFALSDAQKKAMIESWLKEAKNKL